MVFTYLIYSTKVSEYTDHVLALQSCAWAEISGEAKKPPPPSVPRVLEAKNPASYRFNTSWANLLNPFKLHGYIVYPAIFTNMVPTAQP